LNTLNIADIYPNRLVVTLGSGTSSSIIDDLKIITQIGAIAEIRLDLLPTIDIEHIINNANCELIITNRSIKHGGAFNGNINNQIKPLLKAIENNVSYVDIDPDIIPKIITINNTTTKIIVSYHDFTNTPKNLQRLQNDLIGKTGYIAKIATMPNSHLDNISILNLIKNSQNPTIAISMGNLGLISRIVCLKYPMCLMTYTHMENARSIAPGQISINTMRDTYRANSINQNTRIILIISKNSIGSNIITKLNTSPKAIKNNCLFVPIMEANKIPDIITQYFYSALGLNDFYLLDEMNLTSSSIEGIKSNSNIFNYVTFRNNTILAHLINDPSEIINKQ
jgi:3-dehydroquinate dehydratase/shikimate dehydrogenase